MKCYEHWCDQGTTVDPCGRSMCWWWFQIQRSVSSGMANGSWLLLNFLGNEGIGENCMLRLRGISAITFLSIGKGFSQLEPQSWRDRRPWLLQDTPSTPESWISPCHGNRKHGCELRSPVAWRSKNQAINKYYKYVYTLYIYIICIYVYLYLYIIYIHTHIYIYIYI